MNRWQINSSPLNNIQSTVPILAKLKDSNPPIQCVVHVDYMTHCQLSVLKGWLYYEVLISQRWQEEMLLSASWAQIRLERRHPHDFQLSHIFTDYKERLESWVVEVKGMINQSDEKWSNRSHSLKQWKTLSLVQIEKSAKNRCQSWMTFKMVALLFYFKKADADSLPPKLASHTKWQCRCTFVIKKKKEKCKPKSKWWSSSSVCVPCFKVKYVELTVICLWKVTALFSEKKKKKS